MGWFSGARTRPAEPAVPSRHRSLALRTLLAALRPESRPAVLDLGPPLGSNLEFLSALSCRVRIADVFRSLSAESVESREPRAFAELCSRMLPLATGERFDALLAWDLFDYLRLDQVRSLMAWLTPACGPGALVLALASTHRQIPATPLRYRIVDPETLAWEGRLQPLRPAARHSQADFRRMFPAFSIKRSLLWRNGMLEYLFAHNATADR